MVRVEVRLYATLRKYTNDLGPGESQVLVFDDNSLLRDLFDKLKIPIKEIKTTFVNGTRQDENYVLRDGDRIGIFPPIGGG
jgi:sulfur-carrier protein